ncbi:MAG: NUDIX hydrolase [Rudaea sp.]|nr:NUDIX hydrolase [Rudaea sp.]
MNQTIPRSQVTETNWHPDVTVACVVPRDGRFLLVEESIRGRLVINQPAGHLEPDESLLDAARRETLEETGWCVELTDLIGIYQWATDGGSRHFLRFAFAAKSLAHDAQRTLDAGVVRALWLDRAEMAAAPARLRSPLVLRCVDDWLAGKRLPLDAVTCLLADVGRR